MTLSTSSLVRTAARPIDACLLEQVILPQVFKPGRYLGVERGSVCPPFDQAEVCMALVFPELYEIGISNHAHKLLYSVVNHEPGMLCDRAYAPDVDMKQQMAAHGLPLYGVETKYPLTAFDMLAISLQYELNYTTVLGTLEAAMVPFYRAERDDSYPLIIGGGPGSTNPMPLAPFFDAFMVGDGEEVLVDLMATIRDNRRLDREQLLKQLAAIEGVYVPGVSQKAYKRIVDIAGRDDDVAPLMPTIGAVHDRVVVEARRGCDRMCRFCQPCFINLPVREQSTEAIRQKALADIEKTGYEECSLLSLSIADYSHFAEMVQDVASALHDKNVSLSLPSQRADRFSLEVAEAVQSVRKSTLTFAPEAGTPRLRDVINKNLTDEAIYHAVTTAYQAGWNKVKLYFMIGLPTETDVDLDGIVTLVKGLQQACRQIRRASGRSLKGYLDVHITLSNFVPKPHTPFQWFAQASQTELKAKIRYLKDAFKSVRDVKLSFTDTELSKLECVVSKGGEELAPVLLQAYRNGAYLDAWGGADALKAWFDALESARIDPETYTRERLIDPDEPLPWDAIDVGLSKTWLRQEYDKAVAAASTTPCFDACSVCGVCATYSTQPKFMEAPKSGFRVVSRQKPSVLMREPVCRLRLQIAKKGLLRFISHLDWMRMLQRVVIRAGLPIAYTQGFNPKPKMAFSPALPLFAESWGEYIDLELSETADSPDAWMAALNRYLPPDGQVVKGTCLPRVMPSLQKSIRTYDYRARWSCKTDAIPVNIKERLVMLLKQSEWLINPDTKLQQTMSPPAEVYETRLDTVIDIKPFCSTLPYWVDDALLDFSFTALSGESRYINPLWLLGLLDPSAHWHLIRKNLILT